MTDGVNTRAAFLSKLNRLKVALNVASDREVAALLRLKPSAFAERKRRGVFPDDEVLLLAARRPDLRIDVGGILSGAKLDALKSEQLSGYVGVLGTFTGAVPEVDLALLASASRQAIDESIAVREARRERYERLMLQLDRLSGSSLGLLEALVSRLAMADSTEGATQARTPAAPAD